MTYFSIETSDWKTFHQFVEDNKLGSCDELNDVYREIVETCRFEVTSLRQMDFDEARDHDDTDIKHSKKGVRIDLNNGDVFDIGFDEYIQINARDPFLRVLKIDEIISNHPPLSCKLNNVVILSKPYMQIECKFEDELSTLVMKASPETRDFIRAKLRISGEDR